MKEHLPVQTIQKTNWDWNFLENSLKFLWVAIGLWWVSSQTFDRPILTMNVFIEIYHLSWDQANLIFKINTDVRKQPTYFTMPLFRILQHLSSVHECLLTRVQSKYIQIINLLSRLLVVSLAEIAVMMNRLRHLPPRVNF